MLSLELLMLVIHLAIPTALTTPAGQTHHRTSLTRATVLGGVAWSLSDASTCIRGRVEVSGEANHRR